MPLMSISTSWTWSVFTLSKSLKACSPLRAGKLIPIPPQEIIYGSKCRHLKNYSKFILVNSTLFWTLKDWNVTTRQKEMVTTSQGGFRVSGDKIVAPDVTFTPR
ncbi:4389_t:CDS:2, partial [Rhizophagus irregularis]